jgi:hypothetical protein
LNLNLNSNENENLSPHARVREKFDFSALPESLQAALAEYWAVRAEDSDPVFATQQGLMVANLLSATGNDYDKAEKWVKIASRKGWKDFHKPFPVKNTADKNPSGTVPELTDEQKAVHAERMSRIPEIIDA